MLEMEDRISTMPSNIIEVILMCLPIADAVRSSILSSRWRHLWCTIPHLIFNKQSVPSSVHNQLDKIVDQVLLLHNGPIHKFVFDGFIEDLATVDRWIVVLSRNDLKELALKFCPGRLYKLPSSLFSCRAIVTLDLHDCEFKLPRSFSGFSLLTDLFLENVNISDDEFACLISKSSHIRKLVFMDFYGCCHLKFNAPKLQELVIEGVFEDIHLENTPELANLSIGLEDDEELDNEDEDFDNGDTENVEDCYFVKYLSNIPKIEKLELQHNFLDFMTRGQAYVRFPTYTCLKKVFFSCFNFQDLKHVIALQSLLQNSPVLQELEIEADTDDSIATIPTSSFFDKREFHNARLCQLRRVKLTELMGLRPELEFIEFILAASSALEVLTIKLDTDATEEVKFYKEIMRFRRASTRAQIEILD
ncbi:F-box/FBD/LRR-repeat protein [Apostasia shenzhenica]|uniref:F-box/FBD/LRR-repeat protein n=1 Tax=Apostasia shenzhenica TaxID=1088818 RepID=A0A2I0ATQ5_9ASPA|nr:F-box/FBD/LRR-repeat protein [Apostasia shenzhenica]